MPVVAVKLSGVKVSMSFIVGLSTMATVIVALVFPPAVVAVAPPAAVVADEPPAFVVADELLDLLLPHAVATNPAAMTHVKITRVRLALDPTFMAVPPFGADPQRRTSRRPPRLSSLSVLVVFMWFVKHFTCVRVAESP